MLCSNSKRVDTMQVGKNLFTDSPIPLIWVPSLISPEKCSNVVFEAFLSDLRWAIRGTNYTITGPDPSGLGFF